MNQTTAIISLVVIAVITAGVVIGAYWYFGNIKAENTFCENWYNSIEERRIALENQIYEYNNAGFWESLSVDPDYLNQQAALLDQEGRDYNRECYY